MYIVHEHVLCIRIKLLYWTNKINLIASFKTNNKILFHNRNYIVRLETKQYNNKIRQKMLVIFLA